MSVLGHPYGLSASLLYVCLLVVIYILRDRWPLYRRLAGREACIISISIVLFLLLIFGLTPQDGSGNGISGAFGFRNMSRSPIFILALFLLATTVTLNAIEDVHEFTRHRFGVTCAHLGLSVILVAGLFGMGGTIRVRVEAHPGVPVHYGLDERTGESRKLPFELTFRSFSIDEYACEASLALADGRTSDVRIAVNHPVRVGSWWIYQTDYRMDTESGVFTSIFKCVHSPLSEVFRIALWLLLVCAAAMVFFSGFKPRFGKRALTSGQDSAGRMSNKQEEL